MTELIGYSVTAFLAGMLLNVMPCVLPVIPFKIQAVMRGIGGIFVPAYSPQLFYC